jgi:predicted  nucleic acid-binding Zn-ribbon protein
MKHIVGPRGGVPLALGLLFSASCLSSPAFAMTAPSGDAAQAYMVVDCLLPGQVRKLGRATTFLTPRRPIRTSGVNCEIRGGEYVSVDRADFSSSLAVWLPTAQAGDAKAQAYVGRIYADGFGREPDYLQAASWYQKASDQGYAQAMIDLGQLYERGLGVAKDPVKAVALYRKASGLPPSNFAAAETLVSADAGALAKANANTQAMARELEAARQALAQERAALADTQAKLAKATTAPRPAPAAANPAELASLQKVLADRSAQLDASNARAAKLAADLAKERAAAETRAQPLVTQLKAVQTDRAQALQQRDQTQQELAALRAQLTDRQGKLSAGAEARLAKAKADLDGRDAQLKATEARLAEAEQRVAAVRADADGKAAPLERQIRDLQASSAGVQRERDQALQQVDALTRKAADSEASRRTAEAQKAKAEGDLAVARAALADREAKLQAAKADAAAAGARSAPQTAAMQQRLTKVQSDYDAATRQSADLAQRVAELEQQVARTRPAEGPNAKELAAREANLAAREAKVKDLETKLASALSTYRNAPAALPAARPMAPVRLTAASKFGFSGSYAILIGESDYKDTRLPKLATPTNDVGKLGDLLRSRYGFNVTVMVDKSRTDILRELDAASQKLGENDTLLIYYAGHGGMEKVRNGSDRGYWLPVDAQYGSTAEEISNQEITYQVARMAARKVLIVADSCYSGLLTQTVSRAQRPISADEKTNDYLIGMAHKQSRNVLTSGGLEPVLDGGGARNHSIFAAALIDVLETNTDVITSEEIYDRLLSRVISGATKVLLRDKETPNPQQPQYSALDNGGHVYGDFLFVPKGPVLARAASPDRKPGP